MASFKSSELQAAAFTCEKIEDQSLSSPVGTVSACCMTETTSIDTPEATITTHDSSISAINFQQNKKIKFLPINVVESFAYLLAYTASSCSLKEISKSKFKGLRKLQILWLSYNQIEKISSDTFEDLTDLKKLYLCE